MNFEESIITSIDELLKKLEETKNLERPEKINGKLHSLTSFISANCVPPAITSDSRQTDIINLQRFKLFEKK